MDRNSDLSENLNYTIADLPILTSNGKLSDYPSYRELSHWHEDFEFILVFNGQMDFSINDKVVTLNANDGLFINSNRLHFGFSQTHNECIFRLIIVSPDLIRNRFNTNIIKSIAAENNTDFYLFKSNSFLWNILERIHKINLSQEKFYELELQSEFCTLINQLTVHCVKHTENEPKEVKLLKQMINYIHEHYWEKITINEIAKAGAVCRNSCYNIFREKMQFTPLQYLINYRINKSIEMLKTNDSIADISQKCGFCSQSHYTKVFHSIYDMSPGEYRRKFCL